MKLKDYYTSGRTGLSFELFPPKTDKAEASLFNHLESLMAFGPDYVTCTYGAGGSDQQRTLEIITEVKRRHQVPVASHLTVVGASVDQLRDYLRDALSSGIDYIVALRGDPPQDQSAFTPAPDGLRYANELVELIRAEFDQFGVAVAGYPEKHRDAPSMDVDLDNLKRKVDAGADIIITQLFYRNEDYFRFVEQCRSRGIEIPIIPGILPVISLKQIQRIADLCGASLPEEFVDRLRESDNPDDQLKAGIEFATRQVENLIEQGVPGLHFYVLNKSRATSEVLQSLGYSTNP